MRATASEHPILFYILMVLVTEEECKLALHYVISTSYLRSLYETDMSTLFQRSLWIGSAVVRSWRLDAYLSGALVQKFAGFCFRDTFCQLTLKPYPADIAEGWEVGSEKDPLGGELPQGYQNCWIFPKQHECEIFQIHRWRTAYRIYTNRLLKKEREK
jgi:hypothetical protein